MWRTIRIAYAGQSSEARSYLANLLARLGLQEQIDDIGNQCSAVQNHRERAFDVIFVDAQKDPQDCLALAKKLRAVSAETFLIVVANNTETRIDKPDIAKAAINDIRADWLLDHEFSDEELKQALDAAMMKIEAARRQKEMQLGRDVLRAARTPAAILDRNYRVIFANRAAEELFGKGDPFTRASDAKLICGAAHATKRFHDQLRLSLHRNFQKHENAFIRADRQADKKPVIVISIPQRDVINEKYTYHLVFNDLERQSEVRAEDFAEVLNISVAEARLALALARGLDLESSSAELNISISTARSYLKSIFEKTGVTRQAELVRLALLAV